MRAVEFVESYMDAWNHRDPKGVADHLATGGFYVDVPENRQRTHDELVTNLEGFFARYRHRYELIGEILTNGDTVAFQYRMVPTANGDEPDAIFRGAEFITLGADAALSIFDYYDGPDVDKPTNIATLSSRDGQRSKYAKSGLSEQQMLDYQVRLETIMRDEQIFLRSDMTLPRLAEAVGCSVNHLSQVINAGFGMSFFDYLNRYRIDYAKDLLVNADGDGNAILNIAFMVGFNSNSAFYAAFKKRVGQTPAQYRKTCTAQID